MALIGELRASWKGKSKRVDMKASCKLATMIIVKISRFCTVLVLFQASLFNACTSSSSSRQGHKGKMQVHKVRRRKLTRPGCSLGRLARSRWIKRAFALYTWAMNSLYIWWAALSLVTILLDLNLLASYRYLDCYLLGRFSINARISHAAKYVCFVMVVFFLALRLALVLYRPQFHLQALDFMYRDLDNVERHNRRPDLTCHKMVESAGEHDKRVQADITKKTDEDGHELYYKRSRLLDTTSSGFLVGSPARKLEGDDECTFAKTDFSMDYFVIQKLNRRPAHWFKLNIKTLSWFMFIMFWGVVWFAWLLYLMTPTIVTRRGFEFTYPNCVSYIRVYANGSRDRAQEYEFIYEATTSIGDGAGARMDKIGGKRQEVPVMLPMEDFVSGQYHMIRMGLDFSQSLTLYMDGPAILMAHIILHLMLLSDLLINSHEIHKRLVRLRNNRWHHQSTGSQLSSNESNPLHGQSMLPDIPSELALESHRQSNYRRSFARYRSNFCRRGNAPPGSLSNGQSANLFWGQSSASYMADYAATTSETIVLQTLLLEHFKCTKTYNEYTSKLSLYAACLWFCLTCTVLVWLGFTGIESVEREFYIAEIGASILLLSYLFMLSVIRRSNREFYPLISSLMAMDDWQSVTKLRWVSILEHYQPKPMYCFTIISAEISYLLIFRLIAWTFSALFVVVSFFYERLARMKLTR